MLRWRSSMKRMLRRRKSLCSMNKNMHLRDKDLRKQAWEPEGGDGWDWPCEGAERKERGEGHAEKGACMAVSVVWRHVCHGVLARGEQPGSSSQGPATVGQEARCHRIRRWHALAALMRNLNDGDATTSILQRGQVGRACGTATTGRQRRGTGRRLNQMPGCWCRAAAAGPLLRRSRRGTAAAAAAARSGPAALPAVPQPAGRPA